MRDKLKEFLEKEGVVLPKEFVVEVYSQVLKFAGGLSGLIQAGSKKAGVAAAKALKPYINHGEAAQNIDELMKEFFRMAGFGEMDVIVNGDEIVLEVKESFLLRAHKKPEVALKPLTGAAEGFLSEIFGKKTKTEVEDRRIRIKLR